MTRLHAPATLRNREPILEVLRRVLPTSGTVLEIASGSGEHASFFSEALPLVQWLPSDREADSVASITAYRQVSKSEQLLPALQLDVRQENWKVPELSAMLCINMLHISPWGCSIALFRGADRYLPDEAPLVLYGPYSFATQTLAPSNAAFDRSLRSRNPEWGIRELDRLIELGQHHALRLEETLTMPANNHMLVFRKLLQAV